MKYGEYQLRNDSAYWKSKDIILYPSTNSVDEGMLHTESNVRNIIRRITTQSYALRPDCFVMKQSNDGKSVIVSAGEGNIQGYSIVTKESIEIAVPNTVEAQQWTLGISLSYDAGNNVTGDVVAYDKPIGDNEIFSGAYLYWFDKCQLKNNYNRILVVGRVWAKDGKIVEPGTVVETSDSDNGRTITNPVEQDPYKDLSIDGSTIQVFTNSASGVNNLGDGIIRTQYDTLPRNITTIEQYDTMMYPVQLDREQLTKPPVISVSLQDYLNYVPDWYTSKYGDSMTGALRMDHLSLDQKIELDSKNAGAYVKDSSGDNANDKYSPHFANTEGIYISPRTLGQLTLNNISLDASSTDKLKDSVDSLYSNGGTIMTIVPRTYGNGIDNKNNLINGVQNTATYAALISQTAKPNTSSEKILSDTGLMIHTSGGGLSKISMYDNTNNLVISNVTTANNKAAIHMIEGRMYLDSYNDEGVILHSAEEGNQDNVDFSFLHNYMLMSKHSPVTDWANISHCVHSVNISGENTNTDYIQFGVSCSYDTPSNDYTRQSVSTNHIYSNDNDDPYLQIGNVRLRSNNSKLADVGDSSYRVNTLEVVTPGVSSSWSYNTGLDVCGYTNPASIPYLRVMPGIYSRNEILEDFIQVGTHKPDDIAGLESAKNTLNKVLISRIGTYDTESPSNTYTVIEQDYAVNNESYAMNKLVPFTDNFSAVKYSSASAYQEIGGIYSNGNIGCSSALIPHHSTGSPLGFSYVPDAEWVRFTRFRYDSDISKNTNQTYSSSPRSYGAPYNIEFNTLVKNQRANQIIWNYHDKNNPKNKEYQPLILSYIHDESATDYPNEEWVDYNNYRHQNPTFGVRNFLRIDGGGLSVHGDINNPALSGDDVDENGHTLSNRELGITLLHGRVYASTYNDYAETYKKSDPEEKSVEGMLVALDPETQLYKICDEPENSLVVGVISDNYGMLLGGKRIDGALDEIDTVTQKNYFAVGVSGKVIVNIDKDVNLGDLLTSSKIKGLATPVDKAHVIPGTVIGKVVSKAKEVPGQSYKQCMMQIMLS